MRPRLGERGGGVPRRRRRRRAGGAAAAAAASAAASAAEAAAAAVAAAEFAANAGVGVAAPPNAVPLPNVNVQKMGLPNGLAAQMGLPNGLPMPTMHAFAAPHAGPPGEPIAVGAVPHAAAPAPAPPLLYAIPPGYQLVPLPGHPVHQQAQAGGARQAPPPPAMMGLGAAAAHAPAMAPAAAPPPMMGGLGGPTFQAFPAAAAKPSPATEQPTALTASAVSPVGAPPDVPLPGALPPQSVPRPSA